MEGLWAARVRLWAPPAQDAKWVNPNNKQIPPPLGPVGRLHLYDKELARPVGFTSNPCIEPLSIALPCVHCSCAGSADPTSPNGCQVCTRLVWGSHEYG